jgi:hypothetical protein
MKKATTQQSPSGRLVYLQKILPWKIQNRALSEHSDHRQTGVLLHPDNSTYPQSTTCHRSTKWCELTDNYNKFHDEDDDDIDNINKNDNNKLRNLRLRYAQAPPISDMIFIANYNYSFRANLILRLTIAEESNLLESSRPGNSSQACRRADVLEVFSTCDQYSAVASSPSAESCATSS